MKKYDLVRLTEPQAPAPSHWPSRNFGIGHSTWDAYKDQVYMIDEMIIYNKCPAAILALSHHNKLSSYREERLPYYFWPIECLSPHTQKDPNNPIPCDCPLNVILAKGCQKKEHC